jgi:dethiobiotin synthetase
VSAVFVTSSGTGIGKTLIVAALVNQMKALGHRVRAFKPVMTGFDPLRAGESDAATLLTSLGADATNEAIGAISPWRFLAPLSPDMAAAREGATIDVDEVIGFCRRQIAGAARDGAALVIEGIGGVMVPLDGHRTVLDWIAALEIPAIVVVGSYLGSLSHTLTAVAALRTRNCPVAGVVVCESVDSAAPLTEVLASLAGHLRGAAVLGVPRQSLGIEPWRSTPDLTGLVMPLGGV